MRKEEKKRDENREDESHQGSQFEESLISHLNSFSLKGNFNKEKQQFLGLLENCKDYPFNKSTDTALFEIIKIKHPNVDVIYQLQEKINWWTERASPTAVKSKPRTQLLDHFKKAFEKKGPQKAGDIAKRIVMNEELKNRIAWIEGEIRRNEAKSKTLE